MTEQQTAERIVAELKEAAAQIEKRQQEIEAERRALSYSVLVEKDAGAIKKMTALVIEANKQLRLPASPPSSQATGALSLVTQ